MNREEFNLSVNNTLKRCENTLIKKNKEYAPNDDPLNNFKEGAEMSGLSMEQVLFMYCLKHLVSLRDIVVRKVDSNTEMLREKTGDIINYMVLLNAINDSQTLTNEKVDLSNIDFKNIDELIETK